LAEEALMQTPYASFLIRRWRSAASGDRWHIRHLQSGEHARLRTLAEVLAWLETAHSDPRPAEALVPDTIRSGEAS
jgi:hypothetical protein